jgi:NADH:ubiquinone oxidoreductase subunit 5 (subunit L)/multisubunit Na+/H+ antiporter MnhA subunit
MYSFSYEPTSKILLGRWFSQGVLQSDYGLQLDSLALCVFLPVGVVTVCVLLYAVEYMQGDAHRNRFYITLSMFAVFMSILVLSDNYIMLFIG